MNEEHTDLRKEIDELVKKLDDKYEPKHTPQQGTNKKSNKTFLAIGIVILAIALVGYNVDGIRQPIEDILFGQEPVEPVEPVSPAELELYCFSDLTSNISVNVELWIINLGEATATNIEIYVRVRDQNGTILISDEISPTVLVLRYNETCSAIYTVPVSEGTNYILHTIEIEWSSGRVAYSKQTTI